MVTPETPSVFFLPRQIVANPKRKLRRPNYRSIWRLSQKLPPQLDPRFSGPYAFYGQLRAVMGSRSRIVLEDWKHAPEMTVGVDGRASV
jgi:hypothetical protein